MSYNSIQDAALAAVDRGVLQLLEPELASDPIRRTMFLHAEVAELINSAPRDARVGRLQADLEMFVMGQELAVSMMPYSHGTAYLGLLSPEHEGIWEIRSRDPRPGMRVFGRFAYQDAFIALGWHLRSRTDPRWPKKIPLGDRNSMQYQIAQSDVLTRWKEIFPGFGPLIGSDIREYLSDKYHQVGAAD